MKPQRLQIRLLASVLLTLAITFCLLPRADASADGGSVITFSNQGGYVARYALTFVIEGQIEAQLFTQYTGDMTLGMTKRYTLPSYVTEVYVRAEAATGLFWAPWRPIFLEQWIPVRSRKIYLKTFGAVISPQFSIEY